MQTGNLSQAAIDEYFAAICSNMSLTERRQVSLRLTTENALPPVVFSWDIPRTREGYYHYRGGLLAATKRAVAFASYADLLWVETALPSVDQAAGFASKIRKVHPRKKLVYNLSPSFNWMGRGFSELSLKSFIWDLTKHG